MSNCITFLSADGCGADVRRRARGGGGGAAISADHGQLAAVQPPQAVALRGRLHQPHQRGTRPPAQTSDLWNPLNVVARTLSHDTAEWRECRVHGAFGGDLFTEREYNYISIGFLGFRYSSLNGPFTCVAPLYLFAVNNKENTGSGPERRFLRPRSVANRGCQRSRLPLPQS